MHSIIQPSSPHASPVTYMFYLSDYKYNLTKPGRGYNTNFNETKIKATYGVVVSTGSDHLLILVSPTFRVNINHITQW